MLKVNILYTLVKMLDNPPKFIFYIYYIITKTLFTNEKNLPFRFAIWRVSGFPQ